MTNQSAIDDFAVNYPNCTQLTNRLNIEGGDFVIDNLQGLSNIESSLNKISIFQTEILDFSGLHNLESVNELVITDNENIINFEGLNNLQSIEDRFFVTSNGNLENFVGLENLTVIGKLIIGFQVFNNFEGISSSLTSIGINHELEAVNIYNSTFNSFECLEQVENVVGDLTILNSTFNNFIGLNGLAEISGFFDITANHSLISFDGLNNLNLVGSLRILGDNSLMSLSGLDALTSIDSDLEILGNPELTTIQGLRNLQTDNFSKLRIVLNENLPKYDIAIVCEYLDNPSAIIEIEMNQEGCNSIAEVEIECGIVDIPDNNFLNALLNHNPVIDSNGDDLIQFDEAEAFTGTMNVANKVISDFTGLEAFVNISGFDGSGNFMSSLSLKDNTALTSVDFSDSPDLEAVNLKNGNNTAITSFEGALCPSLQFICVDDVAFAEANFTNVDAQVQFVEDCEFLATPYFNLENAVVVFPNPVSETLRISVQSTFNYTKTEIYSVSGQKLKETSSAEISMTDLSAGIYFVKVFANKGAVTKKIVKQ